jgi:hypothetical protein
MRAARSFISGEFRRLDGLDVTVPFIALSLFRRTGTSVDPWAVQNEAIWPAGTGQAAGIGTSSQMTDVNPSAPVETGPATLHPQEGDDARVGRH